MQHLISNSGTAGTVAPASVTLPAGKEANAVALTKEQEKEEKKEESDDDMVWVAVSYLMPIILI